MFYELFIINCNFIGYFLRICYKYSIFVHKIERMGIKIVETIQIRLDSRWGAGAICGMFISDTRPIDFFNII